MSVMDSLITDRTQEDVESVQRLNRLNYAGMTAEQQALWDADSKGAYNASDLNRVESAVDYLADLLTQYGYSQNLTVKTDWTDADIPTAAEMSRYFNNLVSIRSALALLPDAPSFPVSMSNITFSDANNFEKIMQMVDALIANLTQIFVYSGQPYSGQIWGEFMA